MKKRPCGDTGGALESWQYRDPARVLEEKRGELCIGCDHAMKKREGPGGAVMVCRKGKKYGKRCGQFKETP